MKAFKKVMGIFGILLVVAAAAPSQAFACVTESGNDSNPNGAPDASTTTTSTGTEADTGL